MIPQRPSSSTPVRVAIWTTALALLGAPGAGAAQQGTGAEWHHYGGDLGSTKYSPLELINATNVDRLEVAWRWQSADYDLLDRYPEARITNALQATPIMVNGVLYTSTNLGLAAAIDPVTGETIWVYDAVGDGPGNVTNRANRGVAFWADDGRERVFLVTGQYLVSLDARTGHPDQSFGAYGKVHLRVDPDPRITTYRWTSAPIVVGDVVIVGSTQLAANRNWQKAPPGYIRAYDVRTGEQRWRFNPVPEPGEVGHETWEDSSWAYSGDVAAWTLMSADPELGYVYVPLKTPTNDWYGGHRPGDGLFGESLVALDAATGDRVWHYQLVHHGLWDYDLPAAPTLVDIEVDGRATRAVAQVTKQGFVFVLDRVTGEPVWPIEERAVPPSTVPGERASPTQPFPTKPAPFERQGVRADDLIDFTPALRAEAEAILSRFSYGELFTPPVVKDSTTDGLIMVPGWIGGANWNGAAFDPESGMLYVPSAMSPNVVALVAPHPDSSDFRYVRGDPRDVPMPQGLPLFKPPYGRITAIDLDTGDHAWMVPNGPGPRDHPLLRDLDLPWLGQRGRPAPLVTRTLLFLGEGSKDGQAVLPHGGGNAFRAYDKTDGRVLWEHRLSAGTSGAPMTYAVDGVQYVVVAIGDNEHRGELVAFRVGN